MLDNNTPPTQKQIAELISTLIEADDAYFNDENPLLSDSEYDSIKQYTHRFAPTHVYFTGVGSSVRGGKVRLPYEMGSLDQIYQGDYDRWLDKHNIRSEDGVASDKLDGISAMVIYGNSGALQIAYSRGDGLLGADITRHVKKIHNVPSVVKTDGQILTIRAEIIIKKQQFINHIQPNLKSKSGTTYKNARNCIAGIINSESQPDWVYKHIDLVAYEIVAG